MHEPGGIDLVSREPSESEKYFLGQLAELQKRMASLADADPDDDVEREAASSVLEQAGDVLREAAEREPSEMTAHAAERIAELSWELSREPDREPVALDGPALPAEPAQRLPDRYLVLEVATSVASIGVAALISGGLAGPYIAMALQQEVGQKVMEATISGAFGALAGELTHLARSQRERRQYAELLARLERLEGSVREPAEREPAVREPAVREPAVREPAVREPAVREPAVREPAVREPAVREPAVREPAVREPETAWGELLREVELMGEREHTRAREEPEPWSLFDHEGQLGDREREAGDDF
ncbi:hypothetical protein ACQPX6_17525 [Actinomycetospora sp. CA-101289]|uniref:hypothetical protein n=1 Tax=Actinomycetospora sp. CA-101289 TaxID=3239893 RepID=UPI003D99D052